VVCGDLPTIWSPLIYPNLPTQLIPNELKRCLWFSNKAATGRTAAGWTLIIAHYQHTWHEPFSTWNRKFGAEFACLIGMVWPQNLDYCYAGWLWCRKGFSRERFFFALYGAILIISKGWRKYKLWNECDQTFSFAWQCLVVMLQLIFYKNVTLTRNPMPLNAEKKQQQNKKCSQTTFLFFEEMTPSCYI